MATKTISITEEAYERLKALKKNEKMSFSDVIVHYYPVRRKPAEVLTLIIDQGVTGKFFQKSEGAFLPAAGFCSKDDRGCIRP
jgi:predicted CopG family antitoxin